MRTGSKANCRTIPSIRIFSRIRIVSTDYRVGPHRQTLELFTGVPAKANERRRVLRNGTETTMIKIGLTGLAAYLDADEAGKRKVLQKYKYPNHRQRDYYVGATNAAIRLHRGVPPDEVLKSAADLESRAQVAATTQTRTELQHNARAIRELVAMHREGVSGREFPS